jgi:hypothetical protein
MGAPGYDYVGARAGRAAAPQKRGFGEGIAFPGLPFPNILITLR